MSSWHLTDVALRGRRNAILMLPERGERAVYLKPRTHDTAEWLMRQKAICGPERHLLVKVVLTRWAVGILGRQPQSSDRPIRALGHRPLDRRILDGLSVGIGPELRSKLVDYLMIAEEGRRGMTEAVLILVRIKPPRFERRLRVGGGKGAELGNVVAEADWRLTEIRLAQRMTERVSKEVRLRALRSQRLKETVEATCSR